MTQTPNRIPEYAETAGSRLANIKDQSGKQPGDPSRIAEAIIQVTELARPPRHFVMGAMGVDAVTNKLRARLAEVEAWAERGIATDAPTR